MQASDITIIGAGIIGLAVAYQLRDLNKNIVVLEKNDSFGQEASSRNSEVIHAGLYYRPGSLKAKTCSEGRELLYELCSRYNIGYKKVGKLVTASDDEEIGKIEKIYENACNCGVKELRFLEPKNIQRLEPAVYAKLALFSPESGIIDSHTLMNFFYQQAKQAGVIFSFATEAINIKKGTAGYEVTVREPSQETFSFKTTVLINAAGLYSDRIAQIVGIDIEKYSYKLHYCKGQYFRIKNPKKFSVRHLIYPPPTRLSLGIHITPDLGEGLRLGPDARYVSQIDYNINEDDKVTFWKSVRFFLPNLELDDLIADTAGVRAKLQTEQEDFHDFVIKEETDIGFPGFINCIGIESPGLTSCLSIARMVIGILKDYL